MSKFTLANIAAGFASIARLNTNNDSIETEFNDKVLYRDNPTGEPNQMENELDMNSKRIINLVDGVDNQEPATMQQLRNVIAGSINAESVASSGERRSGSDFDVNNEITLANAYQPGNNSLSIQHNLGFLILGDDYIEVSPGVVRLTFAPLPSDVFVFWTARYQTTDGLDASAVSYTPAGGVATNVQAKFASMPSVLDKGAGGDGVSSDSAALLACLTDYNVAFIPRNTKCLIDSNLNIPSDDCFIIGEDHTSQIIFSGNNRRIHAVFNRLYMANLTIDGRKPAVGWETTDNTDYGVRIGEAVASPIEGFIFDNVVFKDIGLDGIRLDNCSNVDIRDNCVFINCRRWGVALIPTTHSMDNIHIGGKYYCDYGDGPVGKEFPLGAVDVEPNAPHPGLEMTNIRYGNIYSDRGEVAVIDSLSEDVLDASMHNVHVKNNLLRVTNNECALADVTVSGPEGYLRCGIGSSQVTPVRDIKARFIDTGRPERFLNGEPKRANMFRADYGDPSAFGIISGTGGTGTREQVPINVDGYSIYASKLSLGVGSGNAVLTQTADVTIVQGDQVFMYLEIDRVDVSTAVTPFFNAKLGASGEIFDLQKIPLPGVNSFVHAIEAPTTIIGPVLSIGVTATPTVALSVIVRKCFLFVNPRFIDQARLTIKPHSKTSSYTGTASGISGTPTGEIYYTRENNTVTLTIPSGTFSGTSTSTAFNISGAPVEIRPASDKVCFGRGVDNGAGLTSPIAITMGSNGTLTLNSNSAGGVWTASGIKAISNTTITYDVEGA